jgi:DNA-binding transcriptional ArsR family regulator
MQMTTTDVADRAVKAVGHPIRRAVLANLGRGGKRPASPKALSEELGESLGVVAYHFRELEKVGAIVLTDTAPRRGALEHYYCRTTGKVGVLIESLLVTLNGPAK